MDQHKFERIDKGIKRPKRTLEQIQRAQDNHGALASLNDDEMINRIAAGAYTSHLARDLGVTSMALHYRLKDHPGYRDAMRARNEGKLDNNQDGIERAHDALSLARAREGWKAASWRAERECPEEWGIKQEVTHRAPDGPVISIVLAVTPNAGIEAGNTDEPRLINP